MIRKKPDLLVILVILLGLGVVVTSYGTHVPESNPQVPVSASRS